MRPGREAPAGSNSARVPLRVALVHYAGRRSRPVAVPEQLRPQPHRQGDRSRQRRPPPGNRLPALLCDHRLPADGAGPDGEPPCRTVRGLAAGLRNRALSFAQLGHEPSVNLGRGEELLPGRGVVHNRVAQRPHVALIELVVEVAGDKMTRILHAG